MRQKKKWIVRNNEWRRSSKEFTVRDKKRRQSNPAIPLESSEGTRDIEGTYEELEKGSVTSKRQQQRQQRNTAQKNVPDGKQKTEDGKYDELSTFIEKKRKTMDKMKSPK